MRFSARLRADFSGATNWGSRRAVSEGIIYSGHGIGTVDGKGRFALPLDMRKSVKHSSGENKLCLTLHPEDLSCAIGFGLSHKHWLESEIAADQSAARERGEEFDAEAAREKHFADLEDLNFDDGGRFFMPDDIKQMMGITDAIVFVGLGVHIQMWDPRTLLESGRGTRRVRNMVEQFLADQAKGGSK